MENEDNRGTFLLAMIFLAIVIFMLTGCKTTKKVVNTLDQKIDSTEVVKTTTQNDITNVKIDSSKVVITDKGTISIAEGSKIIEISLDTTANVLLADILSGNIFIPLKELKISEINKTTNEQKNTTNELGSVNSEKDSDKSKIVVDKKVDVESDIQKENSDKKITEVDNGVYVVVIIAVALLILLLYLALKKWRII